MKKSLAVIGLLMALSQPSFAQCGTCAPVCNPCNPCATGAAVPVTVQTIAVDPDYNEYACCQKRGFWRNFFSFN